MYFWRTPRKHFSTTVISHLYYVNDIAYAVSHDCVLFAVDTTVVIECKNPNYLPLRVSLETRTRITKWLDTNKLSINIKKQNVFFKHLRRTL